MPDLDAMVSEGFCKAHPNFVVLKTVQVYEVLDEEGQMLLITAKSDNCPPWASMGMLRAALADDESAWTNGDEYDDEEDED